VAARATDGAGHSTASAGAVTRPGIRHNKAVQLGARVVGAGLLGAVAGIHLDLWLTGYRAIPTIGWLFLVNVIGLGLLTLVVLVLPSGLLPWGLAAGAVGTAGTLAALVVSITVGLFGWQDSVQAPLVVPTIIVESAGIVVLASLVALIWPERTRIHLRRAT
jgi:hypothetical protein